MSCGIESADGDYETERGVIQFERGDVVRTHTILINDDNVCEKHLNKHFSSHIRLHSSTLDINVTVAQVKIIVNDTEEKECGKKIGGNFE